MENSTNTLDTNERPMVGRKILGFIIYSAWLTAFTAFTKWVDVPSELIRSGMWMITSIGGVAVGGQAFIDSIVPVALKIADSIAIIKSSQVSK